MSDSDALVEVSVRPVANSASFERLLKILV